MQLSNENIRDIRVVIQVLNEIDFFCDHEEEANKISSSLTRLQELFGIEE